MKLIPSRHPGGFVAGAIAIVLASTSALAVPGASPARSDRMAVSSVPAAETTVDRFIVRYRDGARTLSAPGHLPALFDAALARALPGTRAVAGGGTPTSRHLRHLGVGSDLFQVSRGLDRAETAALLAHLRSDPQVQYAQPDRRKHRFDIFPDDTYYALQWHYSNPRSGIHAPAAWDAASGQGVVVAVLDTGYLDHQDLAANLVPGYDFIADPDVGNDGDGRDPDAHDTGDAEGDNRSSFHGTHVAGTVAAVTNNQSHVAGVAWGAKVQPVRVLGKGGGYSSDIADAIIWASGGHVDGVPDNASPAEVINLSLGGEGTCAEDPVTQEAIDGAIARGVTVVVAAGNSNAPASAFSPASCSGVIAVGATGYTGARASYSNYGPVVALSAPGGDDVDADSNNNYIWSLGNSGLQTPDPSPAGDRTIGMQGTSMASPHVAAVVALMQSAAAAAGREPLTPQQVRSVLRGTAAPFVVAPPGNRSMGAGIVDAAAAVQAAMHELPDDPSELLVNRVAQGGQSGTAGEERQFRVQVPAGTAVLNLRTFGGSGDVSLYVAHDRPASAASHDARSQKAGNAETVQVIRPQAGTWYMDVVGETEFEGVSVMAVY